MSLTPADYVICFAACGGGVVGMFIGFSGALAFLSGSAAALFTARVVWTALAASCPNVWERGGLDFVLSLLAFGIVRWVIRKFVHGLIAQPGDAILGLVTAGITGLSLALAAVWALNAVSSGAPWTASVILERAFGTLGMR